MLIMYSVKDLGLLEESTSSSSSVSIHGAMELAKQLRLHRKETGENCYSPRDKISVKNSTTTERKAAVTGLLFTTRIGLSSKRRLVQGHLSVF